VGRYDAIPEGSRNPALLAGFLRIVSMEDGKRAEGFLDDAVRDPILGPVFPFLQFAVGLDDTGIGRLASSIESRAASPGQYRNLVHGQAAQSIPPTPFSEILLGVATLSGGYPVAVEILSAYLYGQRDKQTEPDESIRSCGRELLRSYPLDQFLQMTDYELADIAKVCLRGNQAAADAERVCRRLLDANHEGVVSGFQIDELVGALFALHPEVALDCWLGGTRDDWRLRSELFTEIEDRTPLGRIPTPTVIDWAHRNPEIRFPRLAAVVSAFSTLDGVTVWSETALALMNNAPDRAAVLKGLGTQIHPSSWSGSLADILEKRRPLLRHFLHDGDPAVREVARKLDHDLLQEIDAERSREVGRDERFE
jgi:hypothetical protein